MKVKKNIVYSREDMKILIKSNLDILSIWTLAFILRNLMKNLEIITQLEDFRQHGSVS